MKCPCCSSDSMKAGRLETGLPGYICQTCSGSLLSLSTYLDWAHAPGELSSRVSEPDNCAINPTDSKQALSCPRCQRLMLKYRISADSDHKLDYCFGCQEVWFDGGEWDFLKSKGLANHVTCISTDVWQRKIRERASEENSRLRFEALMGPEIFSSAKDFKTLIEGHKNRDAILAFISASNLVEGETDQ
ncbi:MAG: hypothetical protein CO186_11420 [Zetaproteobacteria bacterium CG_4_9_14_3_um_filter_49_83]|nr:MAG: hypothetical protein COW62_04590 [Zetaproteobacteria bacterium CG17_big_fil_post_rev_8_21_14_2_50_50_13]PIV29545.1 MAG: hypothetical protein COS35_11465 [Zetaproteobacteria bacterium CG02_land_8_20_14_3_00_50_9]PIY56621.1 MAG: hypothetical protein COZ00_03045 [Zetaproteobacteria bacterium CG_4_10_14_0_8_um_filter_49_80]PJA34176.1 MAG: hypothetical protein CO186_11420 [Zetaproteobacteria bacterium CG_4_9_14_3_um_filter_49_83]